MVALYLLDTNILSEPLMAAPNKEVLKKLEKYSFQVATAAVVWHELQYGMSRMAVSRKQSLIGSYLAQVITELLIFPYDANAAEYHAIERARLSRRGVNYPFADGQIAAIAAVNQLTLVTRNTKHFQNYQNLRIENWFIKK